ncbi:hypothetical protein GBAR_LOCUS31119, partial [Geodia barretti]
TTFFYLHHDLNYSLIPLLHSIRRLEGSRYTVYSLFCMEGMVWMVVCIGDDKPFQTNQKLEVL